ncbi:ABC transporter substrate-binding protein [Thermodesulfobacteriota bacterium]
MMLSKKIFTTGCGIHSAAACTLIVLAVVLVIEGTGTAAGKPKTVAEIALYKGIDRQQILEEGARKEGKLIYYTSGILNQTVRPIVEAFQKKYPYIKVEIWRSSPLKIVPRVLEEYRASRHSVDVVAISQAGRMVMEKAGLLQPFYSPELAYIEEDAIRKAPGEGVFSAGHYVGGKGLGYNTKLITREELPKTYQDLLDPKWRGKNVPLTGGMGTVSWMGCILVAYGEDFVRRVAKQDFVLQMVSGRALLDLIIAGEYAFSPTITDSHVNLSKKKGAPVDWVPLEPVTAGLNQIFLPKYSTHPHATMLYIDFDLSKETGELLKAVGYVSPRKDVLGVTTYKKFYGPFSTEQFEQWSTLFKELFLK